MIPDDISEAQRTHSLRFPFGNEELTPHTKLRHTPQPNTTQPESTRRSQHSNQTAREK